MFTGIVEEIGVISGINKTRSGICLKVKASGIVRDARLGDSIAIDGVCLSVTDRKGDILSFDVIGQTLSMTTLGGLKINSPVNMERSLRSDSRIAGHFVSGHIDYKARIVGVIKGSGGTGFRILLPAEFSKFITQKGSVALDGVSLTVADVSKESFTVYLIPHTLKITTLGKKKKGDPVNVELDLLAKYLARQIQKTDLQNLLKEYNYI